MKFAVLIYNDPGLLSDLPKEDFNATMRECLAHADTMAKDGALLQSAMLQDVSRAKSIRIRGGVTRIVDGPYAEAKEVLGGFNIIEAGDMDEAMKLALEFPWAATGCIEVRPIRSAASEIFR